MQFHFCVLAVGVYLFPDCHYFSSVIYCATQYTFPSAKVQIGKSQTLLCLLVSLDRSAYSPLKFRKICEKIKKKAPLHHPLWLQQRSYVLSHMTTLPKFGDTHLYCSTRYMLFLELFCSTKRLQTLHTAFSSALLWFPFVVVKRHFTSGKSRALPSPLTKYRCSDGPDPAWTRAG